MMSLILIEKEKIDILTNIIKMKPICCFFFLAGIVQQISIMFDMDNLERIVTFPKNQ